MHRATTTLRRHAHVATSAAAVAALLCLAAALTASGPLAHVLGKAAGQDIDKSKDWGALIKVAKNLTDAAMLPTIAIAPLAAVAGAFALMLGGGGRQGSGGAKLIGGAIGAVVVVAGAKGLAA